MNRSSTKIDVVEDVELGQVHKCNQEVHYWHTGQDVSRQTYVVIQLQQSAPSFITKRNHIYIYIYIQKETMKNP